MSTAAGAYLVGLLMGFVVSVVVCRREYAAIKADLDKMEARRDHVLRLCALAKEHLDRSDSIDAEVSAKVREVHRLLAAKQ